MGISVFNLDGYLNEEFDLIIKKDPDDLDPPEETNCIQFQKRQQEKTTSIAMRSLLSDSSD